MPDMIQIRRALTAFKGLVAAAYDIVIAQLARCSVRVGLWLITIFGALTPILYAAQVRPEFDYTAVALKINKEGLFRDLFYITVVIALIGICEILAVIFKFIAKGGKLNPLIATTYMVVLVWFLYCVFYGITEFAHLVAPHGEVHVAKPDQFEYDLNFLVGATLVGLGLEFVLAFQGE